MTIIDWDYFVTKYYDKQSKTIVYRKITSLSKGLQIDRRI